MICGQNACENAFKLIQNGNLFLGFVSFIRVRLVYMVLFQTNDNDNKHLVSSDQAFQ